MKRYDQSKKAKEEFMKNNILTLIMPDPDRSYTREELRISDETSPEKLKEYQELIEHQLAENRSRVTNINARMKPLIALKIEIEMRLAIQETKEKEG